MKYRFDQVLGLSLIGVALGIAVGIVLFVLLGDSSIPLTLLGLPATMVLLGFTFVFSDYIETKLRLDDEMSQLPELIEDDIEALKHGKLSSTHLMLISSGAAILAHFALVIKYKKWQFEFLGLNVLVVVAAVTLVAIYVGFRSSWFQWRDIRTPRAIYLIPLAAFVLSAGLGLFMLSLLNAEVEPGSKGVMLLPASATIC